MSDALECKIKAIKGAVAGGRIGVVLGGSVAMANRIVAAPMMMAKDGFIGSTNGALDALDHLRDHPEKSALPVIASNLLAGSIMKLVTGPFDDVLNGARDGLTEGIKAGMKYGSIGCDLPMPGESVNPSSTPRRLAPEQPGRKIREV